MGNRLIQWHIEIDHSGAAPYADQVAEAIDAFRATPLEYRPSVVWVDPAGRGLYVLECLDAAGLPVQEIDHQAARSLRTDKRRNRGSC